jgi:hypothetical protein
MGVKCTHEFDENDASGKRTAMPPLLAGDGPGQVALKSDFGQRLTRLALVS